ncbi:alpha/beta fold hydrolase [Alteromonas sp. ASW11-130]|uniref:alpha/beta fold hydrolase n=1 Tax=Alteromonas sp. ASW11-130 TaxID=3015775 RepID=UPI0022422ADA|nr:alpha/beta hydrolase [Alteromonas sp. ASW11-130]MCW8091026.1 alpha/beta hydrolase [Alteromonas sp. ASW11-130]
MRLMQTPMLFLPGTLCDERLWLPAWRNMTHINRRYVPLQWANSLSDMLQLTSDRVLPDEKVHLVGFSMGGYIAAKWASENSQKVASLTLIGYSLSGLSQEEVARRSDMLKYLKSNTFKPDNAFLSRLVHPLRLADSAVAEPVLEMAKDLGKSTLIAHTQATTPRENLLKSIASLGTRITFIAADEDKVAPIDTLVTEHQLIKPATLHIMRKAGHMMPLEYPQRIAQLLMQSTG